MQDQHTRIKGYRDLSQEEIDLMNEVKALGPILDEICTKIDTYNSRNYAAVILKNDAEESTRYTNAVPELWAFEGRKSLQKGLMYLVRSVAQPTTF